MVRKGRESSFPLFSLLSSPPALSPPFSLRRLIQYLQAGLAKRIV